MITDDLRTAADKLGKVEQEAGREIDKAASALDVNLPKGHFSLPIRLIMLLTLVGGLSIVGSALTDFISPSGRSFSIYLARLVAGVVFLIIAYGIVRRQRWAIWLYAGLVLVGLFISPPFAFVPALIVLYLYTQRKRFHPCVMDHWYHLAATRAQRVASRSSHV